MLVLDSWAVLAVAKDEPAAPRVLEMIATEGARMSAINLGEVWYQLSRSGGDELADAVFRETRVTVDIDYPDQSLLLAAARIKARGAISYADCFAIATAQRYDEPLVTGDPEILALAGEFDVIDPRP